MLIKEKTARRLLGELGYSVAKTCSMDDLTECLTELSFDMPGADKLEGRLEDIFREIVEDNEQEKFVRVLPADTTEIIPTEAMRVPPVKRKPGRPRKETIIENGEPEVPVKRKPGRPKKIQPDVVVETPAEPVKKKMGRPKKVVTETNSEPVKEKKLRTKDQRTALHMIARMLGKVATELEQLVK